jgi:histidine ammonia-lyase
MINIGKDTLRLSNFYDVLINNQKVALDSTAVNSMQQGFDFLKEISSEKVVYGINTGLGPMAQYKIESEEQIELQYNLIRSHASGTGEPLSPTQVKSAMICRLNTIIQGRSGIFPYSVELLKELINHDITPLIPSHGGVGASGDLVQLAHLALVMIGEGEVFYKGERLQTKQVFEKLNIRPLDIKLREGLGLINGTSVMSGIGMLNIINSWRLVNWGVIMSSMINEIVASFSDHFSEELNEVKLHQGQDRIAHAMREIMADSELIRNRYDFHFEDDLTDNIYNQKIQEYYSLRCVPQILGPVLDTIDFTQKVLTDEVNSVSDNPVIDYKRKKVLHGGNFHGDYVSLEMDKLKLAITRMSMLAERQVNYLMNDKLNKILPPFVNLGKLGFNLGMQGVQFTATSTVAENQSLSTSLYVHSIPNNNDNQDIVSMGTNAALSAAKVIDNTFEVFSIEILSLVQAIDYLNISDKLSSKNQEIYNEVRKIVPSFKDDSVMYQRLSKLNEYMKSKEQQLIK